MITPYRLQKGDSVAIVSTARKISKEELKPALQLLEKWGLKYVLGKTIGAQENQFAGNDDLRAEDFQKMMDNPKIKTIWCAKGGYGTVRILDKLDFSAFKKSPKWVIGYSDVTALHSHIHTLGIETLHAQILQNLENKSEETSSSIKKILFGDSYEIKFESSGKLNRRGTAKGQLIGGNLSLLYSLCGSNSALKTDGKILFIEDLDEYLYHIDRMMMNLKRNGMLNNLAGLVVGGMTDMHDNKAPFGKTAEEIIFDSVSEYNYPVCFNFPAGHIDDNRALILGRKVELKITENKIAVSF
ncbi:MAG: LD-carboxypeptidase [Aequorivita sp.]|nr:MAG: LD-carboxypeptidase [Aequorivita sp.]